MNEREGRGKGEESHGLPPGDATQQYSHEVLTFFSLWPGSSAQCPQALRPARSCVNFPRFPQPRRTSRDQKARFFRPSLSLVLSPSPFCGRRRGARTRWRRSRDPVSRAHGACAKKRASRLLVSVLLCRGEIIYDRVLELRAYRDFSSQQRDLPPTI